MGRCGGEKLGLFAQVDAVFGIESGVADLVLFSMMVMAERNRPSIRRLDPNPAAGPHPHMRRLGTIPAIHAPPNDARLRPDPR